MDFSILEEAKIKHTEAAKLFGVSRGTVASWVAGGEIQSRAVLENVVAIVGAIGAAVGRGLFPLVGVSKKERMGVLQRVIKAELDYMK